MDFDFDKWTKLAHENPAEFERQREATLRATIAAAPSEHRQRLEGLQFRLDMERQRSDSPLGSCVRLNSLMWAGFYRLRKQLNAVTSGLSEEVAVRTSAEVIPLQAMRERRRSGGQREEER
ncbi:MAG: DUF3135 domain-containing protein [Burkholderiales bacterium]